LKKKKKKSLTEGLLTSKVSSSRKLGKEGISIGESQPFRERNITYLGTTL
jgi:hypothetical protein